MNECSVPMWPRGLDCIESAGHDGDHHGLNTRLSWTYTACWEPLMIDGREHRCLRPVGHPLLCGDRLPGTDQVTVRRGDLALLMTLAEDNLTDDGVRVRIATALDI